MFTSGCGQSQSEIEQLQAEVQELKDKIESAQSKISSAKDEIATAKQALSEIQDKAGGRNILGIGDDADEVESALNSAESDLDDAVCELD